MSSFSALLNQCHVTERTLSSRLDQLELDIENGREVAQLEYQVRELLSEVN
jgi:DNA-binding HxlR family transcriptional regulator